MTGPGYPPPFVPATNLWVPPGRRGTYGPEIVDFTNSIGHPVDAEQAADIDALASYGPGGKWLALETLMLEGRQNGKTDRTVLPITLADFFLFNVDRITWTSHLMDTTRDVFETVQRLIESNYSLSRRVKEINESKSEEAIVLESGAILEFRARTGRGGRGKGGTIWVGDEWLYGRNDMMAARLPTLSARSITANPQVRYASSAGESDSDHLQTLVTRGRSMKDPSLIMVERCAPGSLDDPGCVNPDCTHLFGLEDGCTLDRPELWHHANHSAGRRISYAFMHTERRTLGVVEFARERLGWHEDADPATQPISVKTWARTAIPAGYGPGELGRPVFWLDVSPFSRSASIGVAAARKDGTGDHVELVSHKIGARWLVDRAATLRKEHPRAVFGGASDGVIKEFLPALKAAGIPVHTHQVNPASTKAKAQPAGTIRLFAPSEMAAACSHLSTLATQTPFRMSHSPDALFTAALSASVKRDVGDGLWLWVRKGGQPVDLSPLYAGTGALWLLETTRQDDYDISKSVY